MSWSREFEDPIDLPRGRRLVTLQDAANFILNLPKGEQKIEEWQTATEALIMAAEGRGPLMHARIGVRTGCMATIAKRDCAGRLGERGASIPALQERRLAKHVRYPN